MFQSLDHPRGATLFLAKFTSKTFIKFLYINRLLWQHVVLCKSTLLRMRLAMVCVVCYTTHTIARRILNNVLLHNTTCCHNSLLI